LKPLQDGHGLLRLIYWNKQMIMMNSCNHIATDVGLAKSVGKCSGEPYCSEVRMNS